MQRLPRRGPILRPAGTRLPSEYRRTADARTGVTIHQLTAAPCINHPPYYLTCAFTPAERQVLFTSYRSGAPQLYEVTLLDGPIRQLTAAAGSHPHPAFSPSERYVSYTSDASGFPQVYLAEP